MALIVADTSALVSLGIVADADPNPLGLLLDSHDVVVPKQVIKELGETASYDDASGRAAQAVLDRQPTFEVRPVELDETFPLDDGENAAVTLANEANAMQLLCDEFNRLALIHASLAETRLVTTPVLLTALVRNGALSPDAAEECLARMSTAAAGQRTPMSSVRRIHFDNNGRTIKRSAPSTPTYPEILLFGYR